VFEKYSKRVVDII
jgi:hypothetical protein